MHNARQVFWGIVIALGSIILTLGALSLSLTEANLKAANTESPSATSTRIPTNTNTQTPVVQSVTPIVFTPTVVTPTIVPASQTPVPSATFTICPAPIGWKAYTIKAGDTLDGLALIYHINSADIRAANCLTTGILVPGSIIFLPPAPTRTPTPCGPPRGWLVNIVQQGDTLYRLSKGYGVTVTELQRANCISGTLIHVGQTLYVPPWGSIYSTPTTIYPPFITSDASLVTDTPTDTPTFTSTP
jgi:LysM repeat protein